MPIGTSYNGFGPKIRDDSYRWMKGEIAAGRVPPPICCSACGETDGHLDYHTEDYSRPFGPHIYAYELCFRCHMMLHSRFHQPKRRRRYIEQLEAGAVFEPLMSRGEIYKLNASAWLEDPVGWGIRRGVSCFSSVVFRRSGPWAAFAFRLSVARGTHAGENGRSARPCWRPSSPAIRPRRGWRRSRSRSVVCRSCGRSGASARSRSSARRRASPLRD